MSSTVKIIIGVAIACIVVCCGGCGLFGYLGFNAVRETTAGAQQAGDEVMVSVFKTWDADALWQGGAPELKTAQPESKVRETMARLKDVYGPFVSGQSSVSGINAKTDSGTGSFVTVEYRNDATFEKGKALVKMELIQREGTPWQVTRFDIEPAGGASSTPEKGR